MKASYVIPFLLVGMLGSILFASCVSDSTYRSSMEYALLIDETDSIFTVPDSAEVFADMGIDTNMWGGVNFSLGRIIDVSYIPHTSLVLSKGGNRFASNKYARMKEVTGFETKLTVLLDSTRHDHTGKNRSSIYLPLAAELSRLANCRADRKTLVIYSDMRENSATVSFYDPHTLLLLENNPDAIAQKLIEQTKLPDLTGTEIKIVYSPKNPQDDQSFRLASTFFKKLLEQHGATVSITANLVNE